MASRTKDDVFYISREDLELVAKALMAYKKELDSEVADGAADLLEYNTIEKSHTDNLAGELGLDPEYYQPEETTNNNEGHGKKLYLAILEASHHDTNTYPFSNSARAIEWARKQAHERSAGRKVDETLTDDMKKDGWLYCGCYSPGGNCVRVVEAKLDEED